MVDNRISFYASINICKLNEFFQMTSLEITNFNPTKGNRHVCSDFLLDPDITPEL